MTQVFMSSTTFANTAIENESEARFNEIRSDLALWIKQGGAQSLELKTLGNDEYVSKMSDILREKKVIISFIDKDDVSNDELKVSIDGTPKTCRGFISATDSKAHILCNLERFRNTDEASQYRLVHHEYAGLAGVERNDGASSDYSVSSQITSYLSRQTVLKLAVKKGEALEKGDPVVTMTKNRYLGNDVFEVTLEVKNTKNVLQVILEKGEFDEAPILDCRSQASRVEFKNGNFVQTVQFNRNKCRTANRFFQYDKVIVQYVDGTIKTFGEFKSLHGFHGYGFATKIKHKVEILKEEMGTEALYNNKKVKLLTKNQDVKVQFEVNAEDMEEYNGVIFSDGSEYFTNDSNKLADIINSKDILLNVKTIQDHDLKQKCIFKESNYPLCSAVKVIPMDEFIFENPLSLPYVMLIKKTNKANVDIYRIQRIGDVKTTYDNQK
jgi:hypothetical protein